MTQDFGWIAEFAVYYEAVIFIVFNYILFLLYKYKKLKPSPLKNLSFKIFVGYSVAIFFSAISKFFNAKYGGVPESLYGSPLVGLVGRLHAARFSFIGVIIGTIYTYELYLRVFEKEIPEQKRKIVISIGLVICVFLGVVYVFNPETGRGRQIYEVIAFLLLLGYAAMVYIPFAIKSFYLVNRLKGIDEESVYRGAIKSLGGASLSFIFIFFFLIIDRILLVAAEIAYSIFYFMAWIFAVVAIWLVYKGFIKPAKAVVSSNEESVSNNS